MALCHSLPPAEHFLDRELLDLGGNMFAGGPCAASVVGGMSRLRGLGILGLEIGWLIVLELFQIFTMILRCIQSLAHQLHTDLAKQASVSVSAHPCLARIPKSVLESARLAIQAMCSPTSTPAANLD